MPEVVRQGVLIEGLVPRPAQVEFDGHQHTSDAGALLFGKLDRQLGVTRRLAATLRDSRAATRTVHSMEELVRQRVFQIGLGYPDCNDGNRLRTDPTFKVLVGKLPVHGDDLASQPTLSRFENSPGARELRAYGLELERVVIELIRRCHPHARQITIDLDPTEDPTHGQQQLTFFNGHYDEHCYLPLLGFLTIDQDPQHYLFAARLRSGRAPATQNGRTILVRVVKGLRDAFPRATIRVRLDGGFSGPRLLATLEKLGVEYIVGFPKNAVLSARIGDDLARVKARAESTQETQLTWVAFRYRAGSWSMDRRIVSKVEATIQPGREVRENPRFVVTNLSDDPETVYDIYRGRGDIENAIKELHESLDLGRTSCSRFLANQFRVLLVATAFVLYQQLRVHLVNSDLERAQIWRLREVLFKIGAAVMESVRRVLFRLPRSYPYRELWCMIAGRLCTH